jgi:hypothetical protein
MQHHRFVHGGYLLNYLVPFTQRTAAVLELYLEPYHTSTFHTDMHFKSVAGITCVAPFGLFLLITDQ